jgi:phosphoribosylformylglycinamidine cyclo-ligase
VPPIFQWLQKMGNVATPEMFNTFNMGVGFVLIVPPSATEVARRWFSEQGLSAYLLGEVVSGNGEVLGLDA